MPGLPPSTPAGNNIRWQTMKIKNSDYECTLKLANMLARKLAELVFSYRPENDDPTESCCTLDDAIGNLELLDELGRPPSAGRAKRGRLGKPNNKPHSGHIRTIQFWILSSITCDRVESGLLRSIHMETSGGDPTPITVATR